MAVLAVCFSFLSFLISIFILLKIFDNRKQLLSITETLDSYTIDEEAERLLNE